MDNKEKNLNQEETENKSETENQEEAENKAEDENKDVEEAAADTASDEESGEEKAAALQEELDEAKERILRLSAEFDNFKKRTVKEKEELYSSAVCDTVEKILPVLDNLERAVGTFGENSDAAAVQDGVKMILKQFGDTLSEMGVEEIATDGGFDPEFHNAVMHIEDDSYGDSEIAEELMRGYKYKGKVIRHSMVKVAN